MGGAFPLHEADCVTLRADVVHEVVAIQWALTHWNQNEAHANAKLGRRFYKTILIIIINNN